MYAAIILTNEWEIVVDQDVNSISGCIEQAVLENRPFLKFSGDNIIRRGNESAFHQDMLIMINQIVEIRNVNN